MVILVASSEPFLPSPMMYIGTCSLPRACAPSADAVAFPFPPNHASRSHGALYASPSALVADETPPLADAALTPSDTSASAPSAPTIATRPRNARVVPSSPPSPPSRPLAISTSSASSNRARSLPRARRSSPTLDRVILDRSLDSRVSQAPFARHRLRWSRRCDARMNGCCVLASSITVGQSEGWTIIGRECTNACVHDWRLVDA